MCFCLKSLWILFAVITLHVPVKALAETTEFLPPVSEAWDARAVVFIGDQANVSSLSKADTLVAPGKVKMRKIVAITLALTMGVFGVHRLYLGTATKVPVIYTVTLGGFGILPLSDIIAILTTKNWEVYFHNGRVFMWAK